jgi:hypothetical protein
MAGLVGIAALARLLARRRIHHHARAPASQAPPFAADPAEELRRKLSETRATTAEPTGAPEPAPPAETLEERRSRVHAKAQEAIEAMQEPPS